MCEKSAVETEDQCLFVIPNTFIMCGEGGNYCSDYCYNKTISVQHKNNKIDKCKEYEDDGEEGFVLAKCNILFYIVSLYFFIWIVAIIIGIFIGYKLSDHSVIFDISNSIDL